MFLHRVFCTLRQKMHADASPSKNPPKHMYMSYIYRHWKDIQEAVGPIQVCAGHISRYAATGAYNASDL